MVLFHGINAGAPLALEAVLDLMPYYRFIAIDTIGQATKSEEIRLNIKNDDYALWADEVLDKLNIQKANFIGVSYGGFILQKLMNYRPEKIEKAILIVPAGITNGSLLTSITKLSLPLMRFMASKKDKHLRAFLKAFVPEEDEFMFKLQKALLLGVNIDFRRPALLKPKNMSHFEKPVYMIVSGNDVFFPGDEIARKSPSLFPNLKEIYTFENAKHMPSREHFQEIQKKIKEWVD